MTHLMLMCLLRFAIDEIVFVMTECPAHSGLHSRDSVVRCLYRATLGLNKIRQTNNFLSNSKSVP